MSAASLVLVRHGETAWNAEGRIQGQLDVPLSEVGRAQARRLAERLAREPFDVLYASDLARVRETAAPLAERLGLEVRLEPSLRERHYGAFQGFTYVEAKARFEADYARFKAKDPGFDFNGGESLEAFSARALAAVTGIAARHPGARVAVFTHGGVLEMLYRHALGRGLSSPRDFELPNCAVNRVEAREGRWHIACWADCSHLGTALDDL